MRDKLVPKNINDWDSLLYWKSGEWQLVKERLKDEPQSNPDDRHLFASLAAVGYSSCRCAILGQDPYPRREHCTGIAFSVPRGLTQEEFPPTLKNIFREYQDDLGLPYPLTGDLTKWCEQGVLLWNVYPSCKTGKPGSHHWEEWTYLTQEIVERLDEKCDPESGQRATVFVLLGNSARYFRRFIHNSPTISTSHPSPLGARSGFFGSKIFSKVNSYLGDNPIDWRL